MCPQIHGEVGPSFGGDFTIRLHFGLGWAHWPSDLVYKPEGDDGTFEPHVPLDMHGVKVEVFAAMDA